MRIRADTLQTIRADQQVFIRFFHDYCCDALKEARLFPRLSKFRVADVWRAWCDDMDRVGDREPKLEDGLDHFKQAAHLAFWVRRFTPVVEMADETGNIADSEGYPLTDGERRFRDLLYGYVNEYLAFDLGYLICSFHEQAKDGGSPRAQGLKLDDDYYRQICHSFKFKTISPHALAATYRSLFYVAPRS